MFWCDSGYSSSENGLSYTLQLDGAHLFLKQLLLSASPDSLIIRGPGPHPQLESPSKMPDEFGKAVLSSVESSHCVVDTGRHIGKGKMMLRSD